MGSTYGHARQEQSGLGAAIIAGVYDARDRLALAGELADGFLEGPWRAEELAERGAGRLDRWPSWMNALAFAAVASSRDAPDDRRPDLVAFIDAFLRDRGPEADPSDPPQILRLLGPRRSGLIHNWPIAPVDSAGELAERLELSDGQLAWLADVRGLERTVTAERLRNYRYRWVARRSGLPRLLEAPKARLKEIQRWLLREILDHVPPHEATHGFTRGRSVVTHAGLHAGQQAVLRLDLRDFFASVSAGRVYGIFRTLGYTPAVAHVLTGLCTNTIPLALWSRLAQPGEAGLVQPQFWLGRQLAPPHLPQGAPTSPALANLAAFALDRRLAGLSSAFAARYSRYADDLTFSGPGLAGRRSAALKRRVGGIAREEGFALHPGKSTLRTRGQRQLVTGVVVKSDQTSPGPSTTVSRRPSTRWEHRGARRTSPLGPSTSRRISAAGSPGSPHSTLSEARSCGSSSKRCSGAPSLQTVERGGATARAARRPWTRAAKSSTRR